MTTRSTQNHASLESFQSERVLPLTESQREFWAQGLISPDAASACNDSRTVKLIGPYDHAALQRAVLRLVERHEALRARICCDGEFQSIAPAVQVEVPLVDLSALGRPEREVRGRHLLEESAAQGFGVAHGPWFRGLAVKLEKKCHLLTLTAHHAMANGPSLRILLAELCALYQGYAELPVAMQLSEFVRRQPDLASVEDEAYWLTEFAEPPPVLELPLDRPRPRLRSFTGGHETIELEPEACLALRRLTESRGCTLYAVLLGAFTLLLRRLSGQDDVVVGGMFESGIRQWKGGASLVANTTNVLPLRSRGAATQSFVEHLRETQRVVTHAMDHREYFFGRLLERLDLPRDPTRPPLFSVLFNFYGEGFRQQAGGLEVEMLRDQYPYGAPRGTAMFELFLDVTTRGSGLDFRVDYASALFEPGTIQRWLGYYRRLLAGIAADPEARLSELPLLDELERAQILVGWNDTARDYPREACVHDLIEAQAARTPEAVAVSFEGESLTYRLLLARADQLAAFLRRQGVAPGRHVGVLFERSLDLPVALLAVLKAGGGYVPLDPIYPRDRLAYMVEDARLHLLLTQTSLEEKVEGCGATVVALDRNRNAIATAPDDRPYLRATSQDTAYVIYTSGSTGKPKGVEVRHQGLTNLLASMAHEPGCGPQDCLLALTTICFDIAGLELYLPLITGGRIELVAAATARDGIALRRALETSGATIAQATPATWKMLLAAGWEGSPGLKVLCGGEALDPDTAEALLGSAREVWNLYGPTETTIWSAACRLQAGGKITIGRPIGNTQLYVLDARRQPLPLGVRGELYIGGDGLARGYFHRPELTVERFVPNPFGPGRLYRTGDLCRQLSDGSIELLGRMDHQVKLRGFRIELGEIEAVLTRHPRVREGVVVLRERGAGADEQLVAYLVAEGVAGDDLREHARKVLPDYMVPAAFVFLDRLPLTANGKIDRRALPEPAMTLNGRAAIPPRDPTETQLATIWEKVLAVHPIGVTENFFELGGTSLTAVQLFLEIQQAFGEKLPLATLFQAPTIEQVARKLGAQNAGEAWAPVVAIQRKGSRPPFFGIHGVHGNVLFYQQTADLLGQQPFYGIQSQGLDGKEIAHTSVETMAAYYIENIRKVQPYGPYLLGGYSLGGSIAYEMARQLRLAGEQVPLLVLFDASNPARPARLISYWARLRKALRDPASLFTVDRFARILAGRIRGKAGDQFLKWNDLYQKSKLRLGKGPSRNGDDDGTDLHLQMVNTRAVLAYRPLPFDGKITLFRTLDADPGYEYRPDLGWDGLALDGIEMHEFPGGHLELFSDVNVPALAKTLDECIQSALTSA